MINTTKGLFPGYIIITNIKTLSNGYKLTYFFFSLSEKNIGFYHNLYGHYINRSSLIYNLFNLSTFYDYVRYSTTDIKYEFKFPAMYPIQGPPDNTT